jgi:hypothetical protein
MDKSELLEKVLDRYGTQFNPGRAGWQSIHCPNELGHAKGDENPSARVNLTIGMARCLGCGLSGDGYNIIMAVEDIDFKAALEALGSIAQKQESMWLI